MKLDKLTAEERDRLGPAPTTPTEALTHILAAYFDTTDDTVMIEATSNIYGPGIRTGLTMGDLRAIAATIAELHDANAEWAEKHGTEETRFDSIRAALNATKPGAVFEDRTRMIVVARNPEFADLLIPPGSNGQSWRHEISPEESCGYYVRTEDLIDASEETQ